MKLFGCVLFVFISLSTDPAWSQEQSAYELQKAYRQQEREDQKERIKEDAGRYLEQSRREMSKNIASQMGKIELEKPVIRMEVLRNDTAEIFNQLYDISNDEEIFPNEKKRGSGQGGDSAKLFDFNSDSGVQVKTLSDAGNSLRSKFCDSIHAFASKSGNSLDGIYRLPDSEGAMKRAHATHISGGKGEMKDFFLRLNTTARNVVAKACGNTDSHTCSQELSSEERTGEFEKICEDAFDTYFVSRSLPLDSLFSSYLHREMNELSFDEPAAGQNTVEGGCGDSTNCYFTSEAGQDSCNPYHCSMTASESLPKDNLDVSMPFLMADPRFSFASKSENLCSRCFKEQFKVVAPEGSNTDKAFSEAKDEAREKLKDKLAANHVGKKMLGLIGKIETAFDLEKLYPEVPKKATKGSMCADEFTGFYKKLTTQRCGNSLSEAKIKKRLENALESIGLNKSIISLPAGGSEEYEAEHVGSALAFAFLEKVAPDRAWNSCTREDYAKFAHMQLNMIDNQKFKNSLRALMDKTYAYDKEYGALKKACQEAPEKNFVELYTEKIGERYWAEAEAKVKEAFAMKSSPAELMNSICEGSGNKFGVGIACASMDTGNEPFKIMKKETMAKMNSLFNNQQIYPEGDVDSDSLEGLVGYQNLKAFMIKSVETSVRAAFEIPMSLNPALKVVLEDWEVLCEARDRMQANEALTKDGLGFSDFVDSVQTENFGSKVSSFENNACETSLKEIEDAICFDGETLSDKAPEKSPYSLADINAAKKQLADKTIEESDTGRGLAFNSLACEMKSAGLNNPGRFNTENVTTPSLSQGSGVSNYEQQLAENNLADKGAYISSPGLVHFQTYEGCNDKTRIAVDQQRTLGSDLAEVRNTKYDPKAAAEIKRAMEDQTAHIEKFHENVYSSSGDPFADPFTDPLGDYYGRVSGERGGKTGAGPKSKRGTASLGLGENPSSTISNSNNSNNASISNKESSSQTLASASESSVAKPDKVSDPSLAQPFTNLLGGAAQASRQATASAAKNPAGSVPSYRAPASSGEAIEKIEDCGEKCLKDLMENGNAETSEKTAQKVGLRDLNKSNKDVKSIFEDVLDGKLSGQDIVRLKEENEKLREEMVQIQNQLRDEDKPSKFLDKDGKERRLTVSNPVSSKSLVFNPRNERANEFVDPGYIKNRMDEFSPNFSSKSATERLSLGEYSDGRRSSAARIPVDKTKTFNADIDKTFLQANTKTSVDDGFVEQYMEHVNRNSGSIEHLVVFENGRPSKIRVPDPQRPGAYLEHPIVGEMVDKILERVEQDEMESYTVYNMVTFGQSLQEFMTSLEKENSNIATLGSLNQRLEAMRELN